jgi:hypothetical protein
MLRPEPRTTPCAVHTVKLQELCVSVLAVVSAIAATGCRFAAPERKTQPGGHAQKDIALTQNQIRLRMRGLVGPMCGEIEQAADQVAAGTTNSIVQRAALEWKIEAVPAMREALFQPDPFTALTDTWALCNQMADITTTVDDLSRRLDVYSAQLVRQAHWETEAALRPHIRSDSHHRILVAGEPSHRPPRGLLPPGPPDPGPRLDFTVAQAKQGVNPRAVPWEAIQSSEDTT